MSQWNDDYTDEYENEFSIDEKTYDILRCKVCLRVFSKYPDFISHITVHYEDGALEFLRKNQPISGEIWLGKFKRLNLLELEKSGRIKFSDKYMVWVAADFDLEKYEKPSEDIKLESILNAPCLTCKYEKSCKVNQEINPIDCELLENWVCGKVVEKQQSYGHDCIETISQAEFFLTKRQKFDIIGKIEKNSRAGIGDEFTFTDSESKRIPMITRIESKGGIILGEPVLVSDALLTGSDRKLSLNASNAKISRLKSD